jgi:DNA topoisomerase-3
MLKGNTGSNSSKINVTTSANVWASLDVKEKITTPPGYLTESELIGKMEKFGIGTDASIATHIENIQKRNYVRLETGRRLVPNKLGLVLVQGYHQIDSGLVLPKVRSDIEGQCNRIASGDMEKVSL